MRAQPPPLPRKIKFLFYGAAGAVAFHWLDVRWAAAVSIGLPLSGLAYIRVLYRARALTRLFKTTAELISLLIELLDEFPALDSPIAQLQSRLGRRQLERWKVPVDLARLPRITRR